MFGGRLVFGILVFLVIFAAPEARSFSSGYSMVCTGGECPDAVAAFISEAQGNESEWTSHILCSSTLIEPNKIITNRHCLRADMQIAGADCSARSEVIFPQTKNYPAQVYACKRIVEVSDSDWAVVEFSGSTSRPTQSLSDRSIEFGETLTSYPIFYNGFFPIGEIHKVNCTSAELGYLDNSTFHPESSHFFATNCTEAIRVGNSGTSFYNVDGEFVGLLNSASHHAYATDAQVQENGSTSIRGLKTKCISYINGADPICEWTKRPELPSLAVDMSTLIAFEKDVRRKVKPTSDVLVWRAANAAVNLEYFSALYPFTTVPESVKFLESQARIDIARELKTTVARILSWEPQCIRSQSAQVASKMPYTLLNYHNNTIYPSDDGAFYLSVLDDLQLDVSLAETEIEITARWNAQDKAYVVSYEKTHDPFALNASEIVEFEKCVVEGKEKVNACKATSCATPTQELLTAPMRCQKLFKKKSQSHYLQAFSFKLPRC